MRAALLSATSRVASLAALAALAALSALAALAALTGCAAASPQPACAPEAASTLSKLDAPEGYSLSFPGPVRSRSGRDGPVVFRIDSARTPDCARFEAAWFGFPEPLDSADRDTLRARVEAGLGGAPGTTVVSRLSPLPGVHEGVELVLDHPDGRRGFHRILYAGPLAMLQVSAVGLRGGEWERDVKRFWDSVSLHAPSSRFPATADTVLQALTRSSARRSGLTARGGDGTTWVPFGANSWR